METKRNGRGRPKKGSGVKSEAILLRLEPEEKAAFESSAEVAGVPLSVWIRERLRRVAVRELEEANRSVPFLKSRI